MVWPLETGFETPDALVLSEQDIFGARMSRPTGRRRRADNFLREVSSLEVGDLVVHVEHGIGRYEGLETITWMVPSMIACICAMPVATGCICR